MKVVVTGAGGQLGRDLAVALRDHDAVLLDRHALDVTDEEAVGRALDDAAPDAIIHAKAWTDVDGCEQDPVHAHKVNVEGTVNVVAAAGSAFVVVVSTDYVFDGASDRAYRESDATNPLQVYGETKLKAEQAATALWDAVAVARTAWLYGARTADGSPARNFVASILRAARNGPLEVVDDQVGSPTCTPDLARALVQLCERPVAGVLHVANEGVASRYELARACVELAGMDPELVRPVKTEAAPPRPAKRPLYAPLEAANWRKAGFDPLPDWRDAAARVVPDIVEALG